LKGKITAIAEATTKSGKPYVKVSLEERKYPTVIFDDLKDKWPFLIVGEEVELKMVKDGVDKEGKDRWKCKLPLHRQRPRQRHHNKPQHNPRAIYRNQCLLARMIR
jgi:hypothetical protein